MAVTVILIASKEYPTYRIEKEPSASKRREVWNSLPTVLGSQVKKPYGENKREHIILLLLPVSLHLKMQCMLCYRHL